MIEIHTLLNFSHSCTSVEVDSVAKIKINIPLSVGVLPVALRTIHSNPGVAVRVGEKSLTWHPLGFRKCLSSSRLTASNFFSCPNLNVKLRSAAKAGTGSRDRRSRCLCFLSHLFGEVEVLEKKKRGGKKDQKQNKKSST